jgi:hypothetical protein
MKKTLTLALILMASISFAQRNLSIVSFTPDELVANNANSMTLTYSITCQNNGTETIQTTDSIFFNLLVLNRNTTPAIVVFENPTGALDGNGLLRPVTTAIPPGGTINVGTADINLLNQNGGQPFQFSRDYLMGVTAYVWNRTNPVADSDSTDNVSGKIVIWYNEYRNGLSVSDVVYNDNIKVYPNPATDVLNVEVLGRNLENATIEIVDFSGKVVVSENSASSFANGAYSLNTKELSNGLYVVKISQDGKVSTTKVTIAH